MGYTKLDEGGRTSRGVFYDGKGRGMVKAKANAAVTAKTLYKLMYDEDGREAVAWSGTGAVTCKVGIAEKSLSTGEYGNFIVKGPADLTTPSLSITAGHALKVHDGAIADCGAAYTGATEEFAVCRTTDSTATEYEVFMCGRDEITSTT